MGSVKDVIVLKKPEKDKTGKGVFVFSDRYSVFDYGEMPDLIDGKGASLCMISAYFFERLDEENIKNHYIGVVENDKVKKIDEVDKPTNKMHTELVRVIRPKKLNGYDYGVFRREKCNFLLPLEVIYRNFLPEGSSIFRRLEKGELKLADLGLDAIAVGQALHKPILDVSTKLEDEDRYLSWDEAMEISGMNFEELERMKEITLRVNRIITDRVKKAGIRNEDGKIEFAFDAERNLMVVDAIGTPDECRFSFMGMQISKEVLRKHYRKSDWYKKVEILKGSKEWRSKVGTPPKLRKDLKKAVSDMYKACCNEITGIKFFDVESLTSVVKAIKTIMEECNEGSTCN
jgi:phosphoribosylaminoimidazole-succinocarboxamide synthase